MEDLKAAYVPQQYGFQGESYFSDVTEFLISHLLNPNLGPALEPVSYDESLPIPTPLTAWTLSDEEDDNNE